MCGIFFYLGRDHIKGKIPFGDHSRNNTKQELERLSERLVHRGPDNYASKYYNTNVMCGFHRLAIVGTTSGMQPFSSVSGRYICMVNGEIYNYVKLQQFLIYEGCNIEYKTSSDCEVVVYLYEYLSPVSYTHLTLPTTPYV